MPYCGRCPNVGWLDGPKAKASPLSPAIDSCERVVSVVRFCDVEPPHFVL
jgi:hypothetical protein